jgi:RNA polymerase sigma-70 factor (ECF subfamily)
MEIDKQAFIKVVDENQAIINKISFGYTNNVEDRLDLKQEILIQLWKAYPKFRYEAKLSTWIYRIALNTAISNLRKTKRRRLKEEFTVDCYQSRELEESFEHKEDIEKLYQLIYRLNDLEKAIMLLYLDDQSYSEIAEIVGISESNVATKINRIKLRLKNHFQKDLN